MPSHRKVNACDVEIAKLAFSAVVNVASLDGHVTLAILGEADMIDSFNLQDAHAILFDAGFFGEVADSLSNKSGSDFDSGCRVVEEHWIGLVDGEKVSEKQQGCKIYFARNIFTRPRSAFSKEMYLHVPLTIIPGFASLNSRAIFGVTVTVNPLRSAGMIKG